MYTCVYIYIYIHIHICIERERYTHIVVCCCLFICVYSFVCLDMLLILLAEEDGSRELFYCLVMLMYCCMFRCAPHSPRRTRWGAMTGSCVGYAHALSFSFRGAPHSPRRRRWGTRTARCPGPRCIRTRRRHCRRSTYMSRLGVYIYIYIYTHI